MSQVGFGSMFPFEETVLEHNTVLREFAHDVDSDELIWHLDREDRKIRVVESNGWKLQLDNQLPIMLEQGKKYFIPKESWHRIIKGDTSLKIIVEKKGA